VFPLCGKRGRRKIKTFLSSADVKGRTEKDAGLGYEKKCINEGEL
jgi:hypothetical protein